MSSSLLSGLGLEELKALMEQAASELKQRQTAATLEGLLAKKSDDGATVATLIKSIIDSTLAVESMIEGSGYVWDRKGLELKPSRKTSVSEPRRSWVSFLIKLKERGVKSATFPTKEKDVRVVVGIDHGDPAKPFVYDGKHWSGSALGQHLTGWESINTWAHAQVAYKPVGSKTVVSESLAEAYARLVEERVAE